MKSVNITVYSDEFKKNTKLGDKQNPALKLKSITSTNKLRKTALSLSKLLEAQDKILKKLTNIQRFDVVKTTTWIGANCGTTGKFVKGLGSASIVLKQPKPSMWLRVVLEDKASLVYDSIKLLKTRLEGLCLIQPSLQIMRDIGGEEEAKISVVRTLRSLRSVFRPLKAVMGEIVSAIDRMYQGSTATSRKWDLYPYAQMSVVREESVSALDLIALFFQQSSYKTKSYRLAYYLAESGMMDRSIAKKIQSMGRMSQSNALAEFFEGATPITWEDLEIAFNTPWVKKAPSGLLGMCFLFWQDPSNSKFTPTWEDLAPDDRPLRQLNPDAD